MRKSLSSVLECVLFFTNKLQPEGYFGSVRFFEGKFYSYQTIIGQWLPDGSLALATSAANSTTRSHVNCLSRSVPPTVNAIYVLDILSAPRVLARTEEQALTLLQSASLARTRASDYEWQAEESVRNANAYAAALHYPERITLTCLNFGQVLAHRADVKRRRKEEKQVKAEREAAKAREAASQLESWLAGATPPANVPHLYLGPTLLRVSAGRVETTRGASITVAVATRLWPLIQKCKTEGLSITLNQRIGSYTLKSVQKDGSIAVGCHHIPYCELHKVASALNLA